MISKSFLLYRFFWLSISIFVFFFDLKTKIWIKKNLFLYETIYVNKFLNFFYSKNYGIAFSLFSDENNLWIQYLLIMISIISIIVLFIKMCYTDPSSKLIQIGYSLVIGGAFGNTYDRFSHGFVIDFIDFHINKWHFAIFNIADFSIFIGVLFIFLIKILFF